MRGKGDGLVGRRDAMEDFWFCREWFEDSATREVLSSSLDVSTFAPCLASTLTTSVCPFPAAMQTGVS